MSYEKDTQFVWRCLNERPHTNHELLTRSYAERGCGLTVHSRIAELRSRLPEGWDITCRSAGQTTMRRRTYRYELTPPVPEQLEIAVS